MKEKLETGDRIEVYRNLHKDCFSVRKNGRVVKYISNEEELYMQNVKFAVQPAGRAKVLREGKKNVHAFVRGTYIDGPFPAYFPTRAAYNPYLHGYFFTSENDGKRLKPIYESEKVILSDGKVWVKPLI